VTGVGLVSPLGSGTDANWAALCAGRSGIGPITRFDASQFSARIAGEVKDFDPLRFLEKKDVKKVDIVIQLAIAASQFAVDDAKLAVTPEIATRVGVFIASGIGGFSTIEREHKALLEGGPRRISPFFIPAAIINLAAGQVSIRFGAKGPNSATCTACSASAHAIGDSLEIIRRGRADVMIAGGSASAITPMGVGGFAAMRALSTRNDDPTAASRPFDLGRDGFIMGEGSGVVILEELEFARRRGAPIYAELVGYGMSADAFHITAPSEDGDGGMRVMASALDDAGIRPEQVDYINAHGTSTPYNDKLETLAIKRLFGDHARRLAISSTKSMTGHLLGAAGGVEAGISVLAIKHQVAPPPLNYQTPDPECDLDYVPNTMRPMKIDYARWNAFGVGGTNGALLFLKFDEWPAAGGRAARASVRPPSPNPAARARSARSSTASARRCAASRSPSPLPGTQASLNNASLAASIARMSSAPTSAGSRPRTTYIPSSSGKTENERDAYRSRSASSLRLPFLHARTMRSNCAVVVPRASSSRSPSLSGRATRVSART
jgi:3-oxoacyl-[acyl-carrier-protein] synthase II